MRLPVPMARWIVTLHTQHPRRLGSCQRDFARQTLDLGAEVWKVCTLLVIARTRTQVSLDKVCQRRTWLRIEGLEGPRQLSDLALPSNCLLA